MIGPKASDESRRRPSDSAAGGDRSAARRTGAGAPARRPRRAGLRARRAAAAAVLCDSRPACSLPLSSLAAWRGVSLAGAGRALDRGPAAGVLRWTGIACGALFALLGFGLARTGRKPHFEPVAVHLGWLLLLGGLAAGMARSSPAGPVSGVALLAVAAGLAGRPLPARPGPARAVASPGAPRA